MLIFPGQDHIGATAVLAVDSFIWSTSSVPITQTQEDCTSALIEQSGSGERN